MSDTAATVTYSRDDGSIHTIDLGCMELAQLLGQRLGYKDLDCEPDGNHGWKLTLSGNTHGLMHPIVVRGETLEAAAQKLVWRLT